MQKSKWSKSILFNFINFFFLILFSFFLSVCFLINYLFYHVYIFYCFHWYFFSTHRLRIELIRSALSTELKRGTSFSYLAVHLDAVVEPRLSSRIAKGLVDTGTIDLLNDNNRNIKKKKKKVKLIYMYYIFCNFYSSMLVSFNVLFFFSSLSIYHSYHITL